MMQQFLASLPDLRGWGNVIIGICILISAFLGFGKLAAAFLKIRDARQQQLDEQFAEQIKNLQDENRLQRREMLTDRTRADRRYKTCEKDNETLRERLSEAFQRIDGFRRELSQRDLSLAEAIKRAEETGTFDVSVLTYRPEGSEEPK